jgi:predicted RNA-binding protein Jag
MEHSLSEMFNLKTETPEENWDAIELMTQQAIQSVLNGQRWADLQPASATIRRLQHELARQSDLISHSHGKDPNRRVRIFRD